MKTDFAGAAAAAAAAYVDVDEEREILRRDDGEIVTKVETGRG